MSQELIREVHKPGLKTVPEIRTGYTVRVHQKIKEGGKERIQIFEGLIIKMGSGEGLDKTFTVRKIASGVGVEKIYPLYSNNIAKIEVVKKAKVRKSKLYYMRERTGKAARLRETQMRDGDVKMLEVEEDIVESEETPTEEAVVEPAAEEKAEETKEEEVAEAEEAPVEEEKKED
ncbi:50S ribosomal protein L19 [Candidatus Peregrinibacteria bacterium CG22_combo_CG10-13_8_21_14_all_44_10]|nr:MAG: 50S ribosomal protein L19 [Candidatus Peregrinibacteria bacterium CG2_30_44_17]PIP66317.1 MAG: 50S ribosomal protein L19 [Candidatus Peregrinibacteria bacterium CG22_combo_CG10-13_8_21_14_all_44_10]PIS04013.1 MAG: 50S ribosomal protein L19 [Candidatus Peregrinibacteria bacterium CG10_big_fil_rev_8_21_14_0_10_44_7]PIX79232.1 MAG: 50S ribosomal protein L19 [Candidatus Peregrinibacteria bacterium CG_4_10_14_3_um_filter_44_21]PJB88436.1 MAG: 50S ribosomal protein L19 [Candidatus Peregriniba